MSVAQTRTRELELVHNQHVVEDVVSPWRLIEVEGESDETMVGDVARMAASLDGKFFGRQICGNPQLQATSLNLCTQTCGVFFHTWIFLRSGGA